ncbi:hypothetical protein [Dapis sp. BLCC M172]|uniref:hypothetical protein n=1 Tax=Dapis sp. BLCC M172 TaxID=2975281 RepID=UPI003CECDA9C
MVLPIVNFYIPKCYFPAVTPTNVEEEWIGFNLGIYAWTFQTYLRLQADGFPCKLVSELPSEGIIIFHHQALEAHKTPIKPGKNQLFIFLKAESKYYGYAQLHIVQNPTEVQKLKDSYYLPHWPQPGLIPRDPLRGDRFENIAFFGYQENLAPELFQPTWEKQLNELGLHWYPVVHSYHWSDYLHIKNRWSNYQEIDAVVAVRSFKNIPDYHNQPATQLFNAWLAGVPAILGCESAYQAEGQIDVDYLEVNNLEDLLLAIKRLKADINLRQKLVSNGYKSSLNIHPKIITRKWRDFLMQVALPAFGEWCNTPRFLQQTILNKRLITLMFK